MTSTRSWAVVFLHRNGEKVVPGQGERLRVQLGGESLGPLLDDATEKLDLHQRASRLCRKDGTEITRLDEIAPKADLVVLEGRKFLAPSRSPRKSLRWHGVVSPARSRAAAGSGGGRSATPPRATQAEAEAEELQSLRRKLQSLSYGLKGQNPRKLFSHYDRDNSGEYVQQLSFKVFSSQAFVGWLRAEKKLLHRLDWGEFQNAVRKGGHMNHAMLSDADLRKLFSAVDSDGSGDVSIDEL